MGDDLAPFSLPDGDTACESSDVRAWWPACRDWEPEEVPRG